MFSNFTVNLGLRYDRDTGRTDSDLPGLPFLNNLIPNYPNLGAPIPNPNLNFGPSLGIAWDPWKNGKTVDPRRHRLVLRERDLEQRSLRPPAAFAQRRFPADAHRLATADRAFPFAGVNLRYHRGRVWHSWYPIPDRGCGELHRQLADSNIRRCRHSV